MRSAPVCVAGFKGSTAFQREGGTAHASQVRLAETEWSGARSGAHVHDGGAEAVPGGRAQPANLLLINILESQGFHMKSKLPGWKKFEQVRSVGHRRGVCSKKRAGAPARWRPAWSRRRGPLAAAGRQRWPAPCARERRTRTNSGWQTGSSPARKTRRGPRGGEGSDGGPVAAQADSSERVRRSWRRSPAL